MKHYTRTWKGGLRWLPFEYRYDPVPHTHCWRGGGYGSILRNPRTTQERRASYLTEDEIYYGVNIRGRRKSHSLPNAWDDYVRSDFNCKNWKKHRRTQWKPS